ncbi:MAG: BGTF surface domain-containing protein [Halosimplex sp.]
MLDRRAISTYGVLFVLAVAVVGATGAPAAFASDSSGTAGQTDAADSLDDARAQCPAAGPGAGEPDTGGATSDAAAASDTAAGERSTDSYPDAPRTNVSRGDIAAIETGIKGGRTGTVHVASGDGAFDVSLTFANRDGRKPAVLYVNTYLAGNETAVAGLAYTAGGHDRVAVENRRAAGGAPLPTGTYEVTIEKRSGTERRELVVREPEVGDLTLLRAPGDRFAALDSDEAVVAGLESGLVSAPIATDDGPAAALGDTMVYRLNASGFYGVLAAQGRSSAEENFLAVTGAEANPRVLDLLIRADGACGASVDLAESVREGSVQVIPDATNETLYVTADLRRVQRVSTGDGGFEGNGVAEYTFYGGTHLTASNVSTRLDYRVEPREYAYDGEGGLFRRRTAVDQSVRGETNLAPGTNLTVNVTEIGGDFETRAGTTVSDDGAFAADLDLSDAPEDARFTVEIAQIGHSETLLTTGDAPATAVWFDDDRTESDTFDRVDRARVALEDGGFLAAYLVPPDEQVTREDLIGHSAYLGPGVHDPTIDLRRSLTSSRNLVLVAHRDADGDERFGYPAEDSPYRIGDDTVYDVGRALIAGGGSKPPRDPRYLGVRLPPADEVTGTPLPTATPTGEPTPTVTSSPTPGPTDEPISTTELPPPTLRGTATPTATPPSPGTTAPEETTVPTATASGTGAPNGTAGPTTMGGDTTDGAGPGFGLTAALAAVALLAGAGLARRSRTAR